MKKSTAAICCLGILLSLNAFCQDLPPLGSLPMLYNGGFAGESGDLRINAGGIYRHEKNNSYEDSQSSFYLSADGLIPKIRTGIGASAIYSNSTNGLYTLSVSPKIPLKGRYTIAPFVDVNYVGRADRHLDSHFRIRAGVLFNSRKLYLGLSLDPFERLTFQGGYSFQKSPQSKFSFTPQLVIGYVRHIYEGKNHIALRDFSLMFRYQKIIWGLNRNGVALGYQSDKLKVMISQIPLRGHYLGSLSLRYIFNATDYRF